MRTFTLDILAILSLFLHGDSAFAAPHQQLSTRSLHVPLLRRTPAQRNDTEWGIWAKQQKEYLEGKYNRPPGNTKRSSGFNLLVDQNIDSSYYGSLAIGSPPVAYNVILDTGSADLWLADSACTSGCDSIPGFNPASSSSFKNLSDSFSVSYGSGQATGVLGQDAVLMAGFEVSNQIFGVCDQVSQGLLDSPVSGLLGLGWESLSSSGATPFWQNLYQNNVWDQPVMAFQLARYQNVSTVQSLEPGGVFTMGAVNSSLYTGSIDYQPVPSGEISYWTLQLSNLTVNSNAVSLPSGSSAYAAIDTGTTLVGGPSEQISQLYAQIPGAAPGTGNYQGYYTFPCSTEVTVALGFGGQIWSITPDDFRLTQMQGGQCLGAFFEFDRTSSSPQWIIGDTFLKNVYAVFRANPASVGFAALSSSVIAQDGTSGSPPSQTIGTVNARVTGSGRSHANSATSDRGGRPFLGAVAVSVSVVAALCVF